MVCKMRNLHEQAVLLNAGSACGGGGGKGLVNLGKGLGVHKIVNVECNWIQLIGFETAFQLGYRTKRVVLRSHGDNKRVVGKRDGRWRRQGRRCSGCMRREWRVCDLGNAIKVSM